MNIYYLVKQQIIKTLRAKGFYKNLAVNIIFALLAFYFIAVFLFLGLFLDRILSEIPTSLTPTEMINGAFLYLLLAGFCIRFLFQELSTQNLTPYLTLPIKRSTLINTLLIKTFTSPLNYILLFIFVPFAVKSTAYDYDGITAFRFMCSFIFMIWVNSLVAGLCKRTLSSKLWGILIVLLLVAIPVALESFEIFSLFSLSLSLFNFILFYPLGFIIPIILVIIAYLIHYYYLKRGFYLQNSIKREAITKNSFSFLNRFGLIGEIIGLELKLIVRHKRTKSLLILAFFFLLYGLMIYTSDVYANSKGMYFFCAMFLTGILTLFFGQWFISWDSSHFDGLMTYNLPVKDYIIANLRMMQCFNIICFILTTPYFLFGKFVAFNHIAAFLFNTGITTFCLLYYSTYNCKRIDLNNNSAMNYQGTTFKNFIIMLPIMFLPMILVALLNLILHNQNITLLIISIMGIIGFLMEKPLLNLCVKQFYRRKYIMSEGFREQE